MIKLINALGQVLYFHRSAITCMGIQPKEMAFVNEATLGIGFRPDDGLEDLFLDGPREELEQLADDLATPNYKGGIEVLRTSDKVTFKESSEDFFAL